MMGRDTIKEVMRRRRIGPRDFFGTSRLPHLVKARREVIRRLDEQGFTQAAIARLMKRNYSTIQYWMHPDYRRRQIAYAIQWHATRRKMSEAA